MLENYFCNPRTLFQLRLGPIGGFMDELAQQLTEQQYSRWTARQLLKGYAHFSRYLLWENIQNPQDISQKHFNDFLTEHLPHCNCNRPNCYDFQGERSAVTKLILFLQEKGFLQIAIKEISPDSIDGILIRYKEYLTTICALSDKTIKVHQNQIKRFLLFREQENKKLALEQLSAKDVLKLTDIMLNIQNSNNWKSTVTSCIRVFLRFLYWDRIINEDLGHIIKPICNWKLQEIPSAITVKQLDILLKSVDRTSNQGKRDYAILVLLASLGVRASEIVALKLSDIHWRNKTITIAAVKTNKEREMPLHDIALNALYDYIKNSRPKSDIQNVFLRSKAPVKQFSGSGAITTIVTQYVINSGIQKKSKRGSHMLRHTFATILINKNAKLKEIADLMGHSSLNTTKVYSKVNLNQLKKIAVDFPKIEWGE